MFRMETGGGGGSTFDLKQIKKITQNTFNSMLYNYENAF